MKTAQEKESISGRITMLQTDPHLWRLLATFNTLAGWLGPFERESEQVRAFISSALMQILKGKDALGQGPCNECGLHAQPSLAKPYRFQWAPVSKTSQPQVFQSVTSGRSFSCSRRASTPSLHRGVHLCSWRASLRAFCGYKLISFARLWSSRTPDAN